MNDDERSDCESEFPRAFAIRHIVSSLLDERIVGESKAKKREEL